MLMDYLSIAIPVFFVSTGLIFLFSFIMIGRIERKKKSKKLEKELNEVIEMCKKLDNKSSKGVGRFIPNEEDVKLYDILVERGIMVKNNLGGYSFYEDYSRLWSKYKISSNSQIESPKNYEDDDGILQVYKGIKDGKIITTKTIKEVNGKLVEE
jgi:hypothetical protein